MKFYLFINARVCVDTKLNPGYVQAINTYVYIYMCNELGGGQRRLDSGATGVGRSGSHNNEQTQSEDGIILFNDLKLYGHMYNLIPVTTDVFITLLLGLRSTGVGLLTPQSRPYSAHRPDYSSVFTYDLGHTNYNSSVNTKTIYG